MRHLLPTLLLFAASCASAPTWDQVSMESALLAQDIEDIASLSEEPETKEVLQTVSEALSAIATLEGPETAAGPIQAAQGALHLAEQALKENDDQDLRLAVLALKILLRRAEAIQ